MDEEVEWLIMRIDDFAVSADGPTEHFLTTFLFLKQFSHIEALFLSGIVPVAELQQASLREPPNKEKPQHRTGGNVFQAERQGDFYFGYCH